MAMVQLRILNGRGKPLEKKNPMKRSGCNAYEMISKEFCKFPIDTAKSAFAGCTKANHVFCIDFP